MGTEVKYPRLVKYWNRHPKQRDLVVVILLTLYVVFHLLFLPIIILGDVLSQIKETILYEYRNSKNVILNIWHG